MDDLIFAKRHIFNVEHHVCFSKLNIFRFQKFYSRVNHRKTWNILQNILWEKILVLKIDKHSLLQFFKNKQKVKKKNYNEPKRHIH